VAQDPLWRGVRVRAQPTRDIHGEDQPTIGRARQRHRRQRGPFVALGDPQPGNRNDIIVYRASGINAKLADRASMADGAYRGNPGVIIPYRKPDDGTGLPQWKQDLKAVHRSVRTRVEHTLARMKEFKILRDHRRAASTLTDTASGIAHLYNIIIAG